MEFFDYILSFHPDRKDASIESQPAPAESSETKVNDESAGSDAKDASGNEPDKLDNRDEAEEEKPEKKEKVPQEQLDRIDEMFTAFSDTLSKIKAIR